MQLDRLLNLDGRDGRTSSGIGTKVRSSLLNSSRPSQFGGLATNWRTPKVECAGRFDYLDVVIYGFHMQVSVRYVARTRYIIDNASTHSRFCQSGGHDLPL